MQLSAQLSVSQSLVAHLNAAMKSAVERADDGDAAMGEVRVILCILVHMHVCICVCVCVCVCVHQQVCASLVRWQRRNAVPAAGALPTLGLRS